MILVCLLFLAISEIYCSNSYFVLKLKAQWWTALLNIFITSRMSLFDGDVNILDTFLILKCDIICRIYIWLIAWLKRNKSYNQSSESYNRILFNVFGYAYAILSLISGVYCKNKNVSLIEYSKFWIIVKIGKI
jgi:hypothetical protein